MNSSDFQYDADDRYWWHENQSFGVMVGVRDKRGDPLSDDIVFMSAFLPELKAIASDCEGYLMRWFLDQNKDAFSSPMNVWSIRLLDDKHLELRFDFEDPYSNWSLVLQAGLKPSAPEDWSPKSFTCEIQ